MSNEVSTLQSVQDNIKSRIRAEFVNLIPDEMWSAMVSEVVNDFTKDRIDQNAYGRPKIEAPIKALIRAEITDVAKQHIKTELDKLSAAKWDGYGNQVAADALKKMIADNFQVILASIQAGFTEMIVQQTTNQIRNAMSAMPMPRF